jgi:hypothetical protein
MDAQMTSRFPRRTVVALAVVLLGASAAGAQQPAFTLTIRNHQFEPAELEVPANARVQITVRNLDPTAAEFESVELRREKVIPANSDGVVYVGPLRPGRYEFFDDLHPTTRGAIVVR